MSTAPWAALSEDEAQTLLQNGSRLSKALSQAGALPQGVFAKR